MSQFHVSVCLPPTAPGKVRAALAAALAPFDMNRPEQGNPHGHWDRWYIGAPVTTDLRSSPGTTAIRG